MKPVIFYVDDEPHNLTVFEASVSADWDIKTFSNPFQALEALEKHAPWVILTDQRMPGITGVKYLELAKKIHPHAVRIIVTGYSEEDLVVESVRKAQIFDYIRKPWEPDELEASLVRAIEFYTVNRESRELQETLKQREKLLAEQNAELQKLTQDLKQANEREGEIRRELECWVPPFLLWTLKEKSSPIDLTGKRDIAGIAFDIINSSEIHGVLINGKPLRGLIIKAFSEAVIRNGGWRESHSGDSAYGHFGLWDAVVNPYEGAIAAAREFRVAMHSLSQIHGVSFECGISLHVAQQTSVEIHTVQINTPSGTIIQKSFDTSSSEVDLLHRIEKVVHSLPGSNIIMSGQFLKNLKNPPEKLIALGSVQLKGQANPVELHIIPSSKTQQADIDALRTQLNITVDAVPKAA